MSDDETHKLTDKEKCFRDALAAYKRAFPNKAPNVELFKDWYRDINGKWYKADFVWEFGHWIGSIFKTQRIMAGKANARDSPDEPNPEQMRTPDITGPDNKVYDLKFTKADGSVDPWGSKAGMGGGNQKDDQAAINRQAGVDKAISLDKNSCHCEERKDEKGEPQRAEAEVDRNSPFVIHVPAQTPATAPGLPNTPSPPLAPETPGPLEVPAPAPTPGGLPTVPSPGLVPAQVPVEVPVPIEPVPLVEPLVIP